MRFVDFHKGVKKTAPYLAVFLLGSVIALFAGHAYLRWEGILTKRDVFLRKEKERVGGITIRFYVCLSNEDRETKILARGVFDWEGGASYDYSHFDGSYIASANNYLDSEKKPEDYARGCKETTPEYFYRFVKKE